MKRIKLDGKNGLVDENRNNIKGIPDYIKEKFKDLISHSLLYYEKNTIYIGSIEKII